MLQISDGSGSCRAGKSCDMVRYFEGDNIFGVLARSRRIPRLEKKQSGTGIKLIKEISWRAYTHGKGQERRNPYLNRSGFPAIVL